MPISRVELFNDLCKWLPEQSILNDDQLLSLMDAVIFKVGDDDSKYAEVLCKLLNAAANANKALSVISDDLKREKSYMREVEYHARTDTNGWDKFIEQLPILCPLLPKGGYTIQSPSSFGFYASVSQKVTAPSFSEVKIP